MNTTKTSGSPQKLTVVKSAYLQLLLHGALIFSYGFLLVKRQMLFTAEDYLTRPIPIPVLYSLIPLVLLCATLAVVLITMIGRKREPEDELSLLHRYQAGYHAKYICIILIIVAIWVLKDFQFAFTGDFGDDLTLPLLIFWTGQFVENMIFIILEKRNLE